jgi:hypothetical protein
MINIFSSLGCRSSSSAGFKVPRDVSAKMNQEERKKAFVKAVIARQ